MAMVGRRGGPRGMRACLPRSRNNGSITAPPPRRLHHLLTSRNSPPFSLSPVPRTLSSSCYHTLSLTFSLLISFSVAPSVPRRRSSPVPSLPSPIPATPFFPIHDVVRRRRGGRDSRFRSRGGCLILSTH